MRYQWLAKHWFSSSLMGLAVATAGHWFAVLTHRMFDYWFLRGFAFNFFDVLTSVLLAAIVISAGYAFHRLASSSLRVVELRPQRHHALILFLSQSLARTEDVIGPEGEDTEAWMTFKDRFPGLVDDFARRLRASEPAHEAGLAFEKENWCMPFVAIAHHASVVSRGPSLRVVVISSADGRQRRNGSWRQADFFQQMVKRLFAQWQFPELYAETRVPYALGIDFYNLSALSDAVKNCYNELSAEGMDDPVVDVTGGTKECSIAGAALALEPGRIFQYVSSEDRIVRQYDLTYQSARTVPHGGH